MTQGDTVTKHPTRFRLPLYTIIFIPLWGFLFTLNALAQNPLPTDGTIAPVPPALTNPSLECAVGYEDGEGNDRVPSGWSAVQLDGDPRLHSTRELVYDDLCDPGGDRHVEKLELEDSLMIASKNIETPPTPGKPFDVAILQQTDVAPGADYSVSSWMVSLCGGSNGSEEHPNDCPDGYYMAKMLGLDPSGGVDPQSDDVIWVENRDNFVEGDGFTDIGWANLRSSTVAISDTLTIFARINSPFQWHGNHAFLDAIKIVRAPTASFIAPPESVIGRDLTLAWTAIQSPDVAAIPDSTHRLLIDLQTRPEGGEWRDVLSGAQLPDGESQGQTGFSARCLDINYDFRIRARAEQPPAEEAGEGARPNHRFPGSWRAPISVSFQAPPNAAPVTPDFEGSTRIYLPLFHAEIDC